MPESYTNAKTKVLQILLNFPEHVQIIYNLQTSQRTKDNEKVAHVRAKLLVCAKVLKAFYSHPSTRNSFIQCFRFSFFFCLNTVYALQFTDQPDREEWYYRTLRRTGVQKIKFWTECDSL